MEKEPRISTVTKTIGPIDLKFEGEQYKGYPVLDTKVSINEKVLCWITWGDMEAFTNELSAVINKYSI